MRIPFEEVKATLKEILIHRHNTPEPFAEEVAHVITQNSLDGVYTHGINRFVTLINSIELGSVLPNETACRISGLGGYEIWDGRAGLGIVNARICTQRAIELAKTHGIACVSVRNTNHWLRGGTYGIMVAQAGMLGILFTNTKANMCAWGTMEHCVGNNPLVMAVPRSNGEHVVMDTSFSQYSYGKLQLAKLEGRTMPDPAGYDHQGNLSCDPAEVLRSRRLISMGKWKGSSIAMLLDLIASVSSFGYSSAAIAAMEGDDEKACSQTFIVINPFALGEPAQAEAIIDQALDMVLHATPVPGQTVRYPGQAMVRIRKENTEQGIPVNEKVWNKILSLK
ncbi:MAG: 3-dehydro-L-gulonate 2-dehydrogenase [Oscillospiraceae bacterium]